MFRKKHLIRICVLSSLCLFVLGFAACGKQPANTTPEATTPEESGEYTITFRVNGTDHAVTVPKGEMPVFTGSTVRPSDENNTYRFTGWDKELAPASENTVYTALYETVPLVVYDVRWNFGGDFYSTPVKEGHVPTVPSNFTESYETDEKTYVFKGWDKEFEPLTLEYMSNIKGDILVFNALYDSTVRSYTVTFRANGEVVGTSTVKYGATIEPPKSVKAPEGYSGIYWRGLGTVKGDTTVDGIATINDPEMMGYALEHSLLSFSSSATANDNVGGVIGEASALLYLAMEVRAAKSLEGDTKVFLDRAVEQLKYFVGENGVRPYFDLEPYWCYVQLTAAITVCHETPAIWNQLTAEEQEKYDFIMKCFAYILAFGTDDDNNYGTGVGLIGNYHKDWNPNYRLSNVVPMVFAGRYFGGAEALDAILLAFSYDEVMAKFEEYGFARALKQWENKRAEIEWDAEGNPTAYGPYVKELLENGGSAYLKARNDSTGNRLGITEGQPAGSGVGVRTKYTYNGATVDEIAVILNDLFAYNYSGGAVVNKCCLNAETGEYRAYILDGRSSPYLGMQGLMRELGIESRSSCTYASHDFMMITATLAATKELKMYDIEAEENVRIFRLAWIGNMDFMYKYAVGYMSWASSGGNPYKTIEPEGPSDYHFWKTWWLEQYGHYKPETLPEYIEPFNPLIKNEDYENSSFTADATSGNKTVNGLAYGLSGKTGCAFTVVTGADGNHYLQLTQEAGSLDPLYNLQPSGGLAKAMGEYTAFTISIDLAKLDGVNTSSLNLRMRGPLGSKETVAIFTTGGNVVKMNGKVELGAITTELQTLVITVDFAAGTMTGKFGNGAEQTTSFVPPESATKEGVTDTLAWLSRLTDFCFNGWIGGAGDSEKALLLDNLTMMVVVPEEAE